MPDVLIENPILNSSFEEPGRHFKFTDDGITNEVVEARRSSGYFVPIPPPKKKGKQLEFDSEWTQDRFRESEFINRVRDRVKVWREQGRPGVTNTTAALLRYWSNPDRERRLVLEVTGEKKKDKEVKVETARRLWVPAINNDGRFGRWVFLEIQDPWNAQTEIRALLKAAKAGRAA